MTADPDTLISLYRTMLSIRRCEEALVRAHPMGLIPGPCHTSIGQEAVAAGACAALLRDDAVFSTHRGHGHAIAKGVPVREVIAELFGRATGCSGGRGGSMHLFKPEVGLLGTSGIVGPCILQAAGAGYAFKLLRTDRVGVAFFGDGAAQNGAFHEGLNQAAIWDLPVIFVCENNLYATEISLASATRNPDISSRAAAYGMPGVVVDGNDVLEVHEEAREAVSRARAGRGPTLLECRTYRIRAHAEGMRDDGYRTPEEVEGWKRRDPIALLARRIVEGGAATRQDLEAVEARIQAEVEEAFEFARKSPWPDPSTVTRHVFAERAEGS